MSRVAPRPWIAWFLALSSWLAATQPRAADLPRVFYTPAERVAITAARRAGRTIMVSSATTVASGPATARDATVPSLAAQGGGDDAARSPVASGPAVEAARSARVEGVTFGRDARAAVWIGGVRISDGGRWGRYRVRVTRDGARLVAPDGSVREVRVGMELVP